MLCLRPAGQLNDLVGFSLKIKRARDAAKCKEMGREGREREGTELERRGGEGMRREMV